MPDVPPRSGLGVPSVSLTSIRRVAKVLSGSVLRVAIAFAVVPTLTSPAHAAPDQGAMVLARPLDGFSVAVPSGWEQRADADGTAAVVQTAAPDVMVLFFVQWEDAPAAVTDVLAKAAVRLKADTTKTVISSKFDVLFDRPVLVAILEDTTVRYKLTVVPRDKEDRSQIYYGLMAAAPRAMFAKFEAELDRIAAGLTITPIATAEAGQASRTAPDQPVDRAKVLERILAPRPKP